MPPVLPGRLGPLGEAPASTALCALQVVIYAAVAARFGWSPDPAHQLVAGALERSHVWAGQPWRLLTATLLHASPVHLLFNVVLGWPCYWLVERDLGPRRFLLLWLASALAGSAASLLLGDVVSVGSSGALFGMLGAVLALRRRVGGGGILLLGARCCPSPPPRPRGGSPGWGAGRSWCWRA
jgi:rhomboid protease GluP